MPKQAVKLLFLSPFPLGEGPGMGPYALIGGFCVYPLNSYVRKYFEENRYLSTDFVDFGFDWEVHPAYRWALQPDSLKNIFDELELTK